MTSFFRATQPAGRVTDVGFLGWGAAAQLRACLHRSGLCLARLAVSLCILGSGMPVTAQVVRPLSVPGRVEVENYDTQGAGVSFQDDSAGNAGGVYRSDDVDLEVTTDIGGGYNVGWIATGEWLNYTLRVQEAAIYQIGFRVASANGMGSILVSLDGAPLCTVATPQTGGWQTWQTVTLSNIVLPAGDHLLRLAFKVGGQNLNYLQISKQRALNGGYLRASGQQIVDGQGRNVILRGFGPGNWMLQEPYMMDVSGIVDNQQQLKAKIAELVGTSNMNAFYTAWLTNYFREADVKALAQAGFNSIRLPMHFGLFTPPADQEPVPGQNTWLEPGFRLVDDLLAWCETNHLYLILDMHGCPGGQGHDKPISDYNPPAPSLWESAANRSKLVALWRELARRYASREWIGGYDLINEPNWTFEGQTNINGCSDQTNAPLRQLLMELTAAVREVDTNHIVFLAGNCWGGNYNGILPPWDANLVLSFHKYWDAPTAESFQGRISLREQWNLPLWLGETGENSNDWFRDVVHYAEGLNIGWAWWPWKKIGTIAGPVMIQKPSGYQRILDYWRGSAARPSTNEALSALLELAQATRLENCIVHRDVLDAVIRPWPQGATVPIASQPVPGLVFAADYDLGRQGEAYFDASSDRPANSGGAYRNDAVDLQVCSDSLPTNGFNVGWIEAGDWMKYTVSPLVRGPYVVYARVASGSNGGSFHLDVGGSNVSGVINVPGTGGWQTWKTIPAGVISNVSELTSFKLVVATGGFNLNWLAIAAHPSGQDRLPAGWADLDIGSPTLAGTATFNPNTRLWVLSGSGADVWSSSDQFHFAFRDFTGNGSIVARVTRQAKTGAYPKAGVMIRASTEANASHAFVFIGTDSARFECRESAGGSTSGVDDHRTELPCWLKLTRTGNRFVGEASEDGANWTLLGERTIVMPGTVKAGLAVCAGNNTALNTAVMDNVSLKSASPELGASLPSGSGDCVLTWPEWAASFALHSTTNLNPPVTWSPATNAALNQGGHLIVTVPVEGPARFFRLATE